MRRHVFYFHGFDPRGPAPYHALATEAGLTLGLGVTARRKAGPISAVWELNGSTGSAIHEFFRYDDLVRGVWPRWRGHRRHLAAWRVLFGYASVGVLKPLASLAPASFCALWLQALATLMPIVLALALGVAGWRLAALALDETDALGGALAAVAVAPFWRRLDAKLSSAWFTRSLAYLLESGRGDIDGRHLRVEAFARRIVEAWRAGEADEFIIVGHSVGAVFAVEALAHALTIAPEAPRDRVGVVTLGQSLPVFARLERTGTFQRRLAAVATAFRWIDVTSRNDSASSGDMPILVDTDDAIRRLSTEHIDRSISWRRRASSALDCHFDYLRAQDSALGFDYLTTLCSPLPLSKAVKNPI